MMKRLLALLIALLLPAAALAQSTCTELMMTVDEAFCAQILAASGMFGEDDAGKLSAALAKVMNGFGMRVYAQENGSAFEVIMGGQKLFDMTMMEADEQTVVASDLFPGSGLVFPMAMLEGDEDIISALLMGADWQALLSGVTDAVLAACDGLEIVTSRGSFMGDAYMGGAYCTTVRLDDSDVAEILSSVLTDDVRMLLENVLQAMELDAAAFLGQLDEKHQQVAEENKYQYILRLVADADSRLIGGSAVVLSGNEQLATLSVGFGERELHIVFGTGMGDQNYWCDLLVTDENQADSGNTMKLRAMMLEFYGEKDVDFRYAIATTQEFLARTNAVLDIVPHARGMTWNYSQTVSTKGVEQVEKITCTGMTMQNNMLVGTLTFALGDKVYMTISLSSKSCASREMSTAGLLLCDMSAADGEQAAQLEEIGTEAGLNLVVKLLQVFPAELLTDLMY